VRAVLDRKERARERAAVAAIQSNPERCAAQLAHLQACIALVEDAE